MYEIEFFASAAKEFRSLNPPIKDKISKSIDGLMLNPRPRGFKKLKGKKDLYRIRSGVYRIVYKIDDEHELILVTRIRHRKDVYQ